MSEYRLLKEITVPEPFDRAIANIELGTNANDFSNGLDLSVSAFFGSEIASFRLDSGGILDVNCSINQADVILKFRNCVSSNIDRSNEYRVVGANFERKSTTEIKKESNNAKKGQLQSNIGGITPDLIAKGSIEAAKSSFISDQVNHNGRFNTEQIDIGHDHINIRENVDKSPLIGKLLNIPRCWRIEPIDKNLPYAVIAELRVRRLWMPLTKPEIRSGVSGLKDKLSKVWHGSTVEDEFHREAFTLLLEHLIKKNLQSKNETTYASLAARAIIVAPSTDPMDSSVLNAQSIDRNIVLPADLLLQSITNTPAKVGYLLEKAGIPQRDIKILLEKIKMPDIIETKIEGGRIEIETKFDKNNSIVGKLRDVIKFIRFRFKY